MAGHVVYTYLTELNKYNVVGTTNNNNLEGISLKMNIFDRKEVENVIEDVKPDIIINCIGMLIRSSRSNPTRQFMGMHIFHIF